MDNKVAWIDDIHEITVIGDMESLFLNRQSPLIYIENKQSYIQTKAEKINHSKAKIRYHEELPIGENLFLLWNDIKIPIYPGAIVRTNWFDENYSNLDVELGATCHRASTTFSIWAPTATVVKVELNDKKIPLKRQNRGVWTLTVDGDWHGCPYIYDVTLNGESTLVNDPYAKAMLPNSEKGIIIDFTRTKSLKDSSVSRPKLDSLQDAIIYELHVRDATIHVNSGVKNRGKFLGLTEKNTTNSNGYPTALSYIKDLGVTHVQLLPINDFARVNELDPDTSYNWGYDPLFFQVPEGSYSLIPNDPVTRINECKTMIDSFHQEEISVILDVVYNHVFIMEESPFEKIVPGYYFRYHPNGAISNGTGVGNDIASERQMVRKFILDTISFWLEEYQVDGFRFDLMGALDIETMRQIRDRCKEEPIPIMLLGEGWELDTALPPHHKATSGNSHQLNGVGYFNDLFRDTIKGNLFYHHDSGYVNGNGHYVERIAHLVTGSVLEEYGIPFVSNINQTINYVECHDNHTLWDRLLLTNPDASVDERKKIHQLATGLTLLSQGIPFIHAGQEWFRTKKGVENSYISSDEINQLDWDRRELEDENIQFVKSLISLRKTYEVFRLKSKDEIRRRFHILETQPPIFGFTLLGDDADISIYVNPTDQKVPLHLPSSGKWFVTLSNIQSSKQVIGEFTSINPFELLALKKSRKTAGKEDSVLFVNTSE
ncbi:type I pullulanase [Oceanobacillus sp. Castelsardo]|uniref:type I pullulanase n=1 Tax=Oceanobacillus sp. Castelsardo TaxID=1851204 RepID=UPI00083875B7|nr:type I pullulanase [Oceanobacillus sp. Castelsardo]